MKMMQNFLTTRLKIRLIFLSLKPRCHIMSHHGFYRQPKCRHNTLDFAQAQNRVAGVSPAPLRGDATLKTVGLRRRKNKNRNGFILCDFFIFQTYSRKK